MTYSEQFASSHNMSQKILKASRQTDSRAGEGKHKISLEHLVVAESKEMFKNKKMKKAC